jgi:FAD/FMN-containing dehydrogenase
MQTTPSPATIAGELRTAVRGGVTAPDDPGYDAARAAFEAGADQRPLAVVEPVDAEDVAAVLRTARDAGVRVAAQAGGHGATGGLEDAILIRTDALRAIEVDAGERRARVGAGVRWGELHAQTAPLGLYGVSGSAPGVSVVGYVLGGGLSWFGRAHGFGANGVLAVELVDAGGEQRRVTADSDPELFWALRGGGGSFGIVTAVEIALHAATGIYGGQLMWPGEAAGDVLRAWRRWVDAVPEQLTSVATVFQFPPVPDVPAELRGRWVAWVGFAYAGGETPGRALAAPLREALGEPMLDDVRVMAADELGSIAKEPTEAMPALLRSELLDDLDDGAIDAITGLVGPGTESGLLLVQVRHLGGALGRAPEVPSAASHVASPFMAYALGVPMGGPPHAAAIAGSLRSLTERLAPVASGGTVLTFLAAGEDMGRVYGARDLERLRAVKQRVDPDGVVRANHELPAA